MHIMHLAHLKFPDLVGGNSSLQFDLEDKSQGSITPVQVLSQLEI
jgi:hypothetical protein